MPTRDGILGAGILALVSALVVYGILPGIIQPLLRLLLLPRYRLQVHGLEHLPPRGPALLAANHVSWIDGFLLAASCPRRGRALVNASLINRPVVRTLARRAGLIPVPFTGPRAVRSALSAAREALDRGEVVGMFPEGQLTRNGLVGPFYRGLEAILKDRDHVPVIPVYLENLWGSLFSFSGGRFFRKRPEGWRRTVTIVYGAPVDPPRTAFAVRQALIATGVLAAELRETPARPLETIDPSLPHLDHPELGRLTGSAPDFHRGDVHQVGHKPGSAGHPLPGVALRVVDEHGQALGPETTGRLQARVAGRATWADTGLNGSLDPDGFVRISDSRER